jgi:hypothetical protein
MLTNSATRARAALEERLDHEAPQARLRRGAVGGDQRGRRLVTEARDGGPPLGTGELGAHRVGDARTWS